MFWRAVCPGSACTNPNTVTGSLQFSIGLDNQPAETERHPGQLLLSTGELLQAEICPHHDFCCQNEITKFGSEIALISNQKEVFKK